MKNQKNQLQHESSPYLLQHASNPVDWLPWCDEVFERAKQENKLVLISIGYAACHWCHVMEKECFEDEEVAAIMNKYFINVKVDREERPDVDQVYMTAVQLMSQQGGWPLNCFTLPDGRPIYGGTYFPKDRWMHILQLLEQTFRNDAEKVEAYAKELHEGIQRSELIEEPIEDKGLNEEQLHELVLRWSRSFDSLEGGESRAPKFPLPSNYSFLLNYAVAFEDAKILTHVKRTLDKMAMGGIYDQVGGGFSRYSVDMLWKVPHFEKMLYDNGQLLTLYSNAHSHFKQPLYKQVVYQTIEWLSREMQAPSGAFYAALDADSEGEEGKFYSWSKQELEVLLKEKFSWAFDFYTINQRGYWEDEKYILLRTESDQDFQMKMQWSALEFERNINELNQYLLDIRSERQRPLTDTKTLTSWNAMTMKGLVSAYGAFAEDEFLLLALKTARWIKNEQLDASGILYRNEQTAKSRIPGFLEDYVHTIDAFISLYQATFDQEWLFLAEKLTNTALNLFGHEQSGMCYFSANDTSLIARKMELTDNVIPSSNSVMANNLYQLGMLLANDEYLDRSRQMLVNISDGMEYHGSMYSNWGELYMRFICKQYQAVICGDDFQQKRKLLQKEYLPHVLYAGGIEENMPLLKGKHEEGKTRIHVCTNGSCLIPTTAVDDALRQLSNKH